MEDGAAHVVPGGPHLHIAAAFHTGAVLQRIAAQAGLKATLIVLVRQAKLRRHDAAVQLYPLPLRFRFLDVFQQTAAGRPLFSVLVHSVTGFPAGKQGRMLFRFGVSMAQASVLILSIISSK